MSSLTLGPYTTTLPHHRHLPLDIIFFSSLLILEAWLLFFFFLMQIPRLQNQRLHFSRSRVRLEDLKLWEWCVGICMLNNPLPALSLGLVQQLLTIYTLCLLSLPSTNWFFLHTQSASFPAHKSEHVGPTVKHLQCLPCTQR